MNCKGCPLAAPIHEGDRLSFYCRVNNGGLTLPLSAAEAPGALDRDCQFPDFSAAVKPHLKRQKARLLRESAELRRSLADREEKLAAVESLEAEVL